MHAVAMVEAGAIVICLACLPVGVQALIEEPSSGDQEVAFVETVPMTESLDSQATTSGAGLAGTAGIFLLLGAGTLGVAHRRRWGHQRAGADESVAIGQETPKAA